MQINTFFGNAAGEVSISGMDDKTVGKVTLISNEYAGRDPNTNEAIERSVSIQFIAFGKMAERLQKLVMKGDQLLVTYRIQNNNYEKDGITYYGYSFIITDLAPGAPGKVKREKFVN